MFPEEVQIFFPVVLGAIGLYVARGDESWKGFLLFIPIIGIVDGLLLPIIVLPERLLRFEQRQMILFESVTYAIILLAFGLLIGWITWKEHTLKRRLADRSLQKWESALLCFVGVFQLLFSNLINRPLALIDPHMENSIALKFIIVLLGISSFVMTVTVIIIIFVGNRRAYYFNKVSDMQYNMIVMMAEIVENRDADTGGHIQRTAKYVEVIAKQMKAMGMYPEIMTDQYVKDLMVAAPLHDIGKIHVSDFILNKPGRFTPEEFEQMKVHAPEGRKLLIHAKKHLGDFSYLDMAIEVAGAHHEWWNGDEKGYPDGIAGEEIPLSARIMAVADVFDALTARRVYKDPMPFNKAVNIILEEKGTHFDPTVVDAFVAASQKLKTELDQFESMDQHSLCDHED